MAKPLQQWGIFSEALSIDECMVPYYGHYSCKIMDDDIFMYAMQTYAGKETDRKNEPHGLRVVKHMVSHLNEPNKYHVYFDNFITSHYLMKEMARRGIKATCTVRNAEDISNTHVMENSCGKTCRCSRAKHHTAVASYVIRCSMQTSIYVDVMDKMLSSYRPKNCLHARCSHMRTQILELYLFISDRFMT
ncbi:PiggyBac transposable element-derived protein 3 [Trichinella patagoniensis]|uniref:PiggyBac transposable element-derived protein 3 n=1 Tax=Trichinella patagoniensis TaxID=990121 RepID=A0A0V0ZQK0_9BILA|nr:PiggyBac transposable element-derived protein 3 [Trichinella patagoniensis]